LFVVKKGEKRIPFGDDRKKGNGKGKREKQIPFGDDRKKGKGKGESEKQIPFGDDNKKGNGNGNDKGGRQKRRAALEAQPSFDLYI